MIKKLTSLLGLLAAGGVAIYSTGTLPNLQPTTGSGRQVVKPDGKIKLSPSNKFNTRDAFSRLQTGDPFGTALYGQTRASRTPIRIAAAMNVADSVVLYGLNHRDDTWQTMSPLASKVFSFHAAPELNFLEASPLDLETPMAAFHAKGHFHLLFSTREEDDNYNSFCTVIMKVYDDTTWELLDTVTLADSVEGWDFFLRQVAAYDPVTDKVYTMSWGDGKPLLSLDLATNELKVVGGDANKFVQTMFVDGNGTLYGITYNEKKLYTIDKETGGMTEVGDIDLPFGLSANPMSATLDPATGKIYWVAVDGNSLESAIFLLDPATAKVDKIADMPGNEHILGLYIPEAPANAPAAPTKLAYQGGVLNIKAPSQTYHSGEKLSGKLTLTVESEGKVIKEAELTPGEEKSIDLPLADGAHHLIIKVSNAAGASPERRLDTFVGNDAPCAVRDLTLSMEDTKNAVLTWNAPDRAVHGAAIDDNTLSYSIVRWPDEVVVAENIKETTFTEPIPETHARYYYEVAAYSGDVEGEHAMSNVVTGGDIWVTPYTETFETQDDFDSFKVVDANSDSQTWTFMKANGESSGEAYLHGNGTADVDTGIYEGNGNDDYLISPSVRLKAGVDYRMSFDTYENWFIYEYLSIYLGKEQNVTGNETKIFSSDKIQGNTSTTFIFNVAEDGLYNFLFHGDNPGQSVAFTLDNIALDEYAAFNGPDCVTDLTAKAGAMGKLENELSFTLPTMTYKGETLTEIDRVEIYRNGSRKPVKIFDSVKPGEKLTWLDTDVEQGMVNYRVLVFNSAGQGKEGLVSNWIGLDHPAVVTNARIRMNSDYQAVATFDKVGGVGMHGGYVDPADVKYALYRYNEYSWDNPWEQVTEFTDATEITDTSYSGWGQAWVDYAIVASNSAGLSDGNMQGIVLGEPYARPYNESFAYAFASLGPWTLMASSYDYAWKMVDGSGLRTKPYDNDGGMLQFSYIAEDSPSQVIIGPRISLKESSEPQLSFFMTHGFEAEEEDLSLDVYLNYADEGWVKTATIPYNDGTTGWGRYALPLRNDADNVQIAFGANAIDASAAIYIDAIAIDEGIAKDMAVQNLTLSHKRINAGESATADVTVANYGTEEANGFQVVLLDDGKELMSRTIDALAPNAVTHVAFELATTRKDASRQFVLTAEARLQGDSDHGNDASLTAGLYVKESTLPGVAGLSGKNEGEDVALTWQKPANDEITDAVTDDFDSYESFIIDGIGDWTTYDGDGTPTVYFGGPEIPNCFSPKAWQIWAPEEAGFSLEKFEVLRPHSGDKVLACWAASDGATTTLPNDDWLISSEVTGGTDISFWYRMPNDGSDPQKFEMMYSTTDSEPESFQAFDSGEIAFGTDWVYFEFTLPRDARYFAVRSCSEGSYTVAFLDDITYTPLYGSTTKLTLNGYNVYRDDELIAENVSGTEFTDKGAATAIHQYNVTANWKEGESNYSDTFENVGLGIRGDKADAVRIRVEDNTIVISGAEGMRTQILTAQGLAICDRVAESTLRISVEPGIYLVSVNGRTFKVIAR